MLREAAAWSERAVLLFSGGKDSAVLVHLARKAFWPAPPPFPLLHVETGRDFEETLAFRDALAARLDLELIVRRVQDTIDRGRAREDPDSPTDRNRLQSVTLRDALAELEVDAAIAGARRDEEKARAKERFFSHRDRAGLWDPRRQRPEPWDMLQGHKAPGEHFRVYPLSNWTELDVWRYVEICGIEVPPLYFAHEREVVFRDGGWLARSRWVQPRDGERCERRTVRFRTVGDAVCTRAIESWARTPAEVVAEVARSRLSERSVRRDDADSETSMEDRKREGYF